MSVHVAITRRVRPGHEAEFQRELLEFFQSSLSDPGVRGALLITPPPGSESREYGILRTFGSAAERDAFYASPKFLAWDQRARTLTEGEPEYRPLHGLETWFRSPGPPPPRWKMALVTFLGVFPVAMTLNLTLGPKIQDWHFLLRHAVFNACVVVLLTWAIMPVLTRILHSWLHTHPTPSTP